MNRQQLLSMPVSGRPVATQAAFGDLWTVDNRGLVQRIGVDPPS